MPIYEYVCEEDGQVIELIRPMSDADKPVEDPESKGRTFKRRHSTFAAGGSSSNDAPPSCSCCGPGGTCGLG